MSTVNASRQANWPVMALASGFNLAHVFKSLGKDHKTELYNWITTDIRKGLPVLAGDEIAQIVGEQVVHRFAQKAHITDEIAHKVLREMVLRLYTHLSIDGQMPSDRKLQLAEAQLRHHLLGSVFPPYERPGQLVRTTGCTVSQNGALAGLGV